MPIQFPKRGAIPSPKSALAAAIPFTAVVGAPPNFITIPAHISMWGNDVHGDCVTAEEAFARACNNPEIFISDNEVITWATKHGVLEGAYINQVMQWMQNDGFPEGSKIYDDGPYLSVNWTNSTTLQSAISKGPVKIGVAADQLETAWNTTNGQTGWFAVGFHADNNEDHCPSLCGYGTLAWLAQQLHVQVPAGVDGTKIGYAMFTWNSIGIIDEPSLIAVTHEAWLRQPTTVIVTPDILPGAPIAQGHWSSVQAGHQLIQMHDGRVLDWLAAQGSWRLWNYDPTNPTDVLPGTPIAQGHWSSVQAGHQLIQMHDGRVLDWLAAQGSWRLWNYDPTNPTDVLPGTPIAQGHWSSIQAGHQLIQMHDGRVLDWVAADGSWRLWNYDPTNPTDVLPGAPIAQGNWSSIRNGHQLIQMHDGRVLDWVAADGSWRLWNYDPTNPTDVLPGAPIAQGNWSSIRNGHQLIQMHDGRVLDWVAADGSWRLWNYKS